MERFIVFINFAILLTKSNKMKEYKKIKTIVNLPSVKKVGNNDNTDDVKSLFIGTPITSFPSNLFKYNTSIKCSNFPDIWCQ